LEATGRSIPAGKLSSGGNGKYAGRNLRCAVLLTCSASCAETFDNRRRGLLLNLFRSALDRIAGDSADRIVDDAHNLRITPLFGFGRSPETASRTTSRNTALTSIFHGNAGSRCTPRSRKLAKSCHNPFRKALAGFWLPIRSDPKIGASIAGATRRRQSKTVSGDRNSDSFAPPALLAPSNAGFLPAFHQRGMPAPPVYLFGLDPALLNQAWRIGPDVMSRAMPSRNLTEIRIDHDHCHAICEEIGYRLGEALRRDPAEMPPKLQRLMDRLAAQETALAPSIVPAMEDMRLPMVQHSLGTNARRTSDLG
jgi:hypothetical protein